MEARSRTHSFPHLYICEAKCGPHGFFAAACTAAADAAAIAPADASLSKRLSKKQPAELWTCLLELRYIWDLQGMCSLVDVSSLVSFEWVSAFSFMIF